MSREFVWALSLLLLLDFLRAASGHAQVLQLGLSFDGPNIHDSEPLPGDPYTASIDMTGAVGEEQIVEIVNGRYAVYRKSDGALLQGTTTDRFWSDVGAHAFWSS